MMPYDLDTSSTVGSISSVSSIASNLTIDFHSSNSSNNHTSHHDSTPVSNASEWSPLPKIGRGIVIGKHSPDPTRPHDVGLNLGDEVYIFEAHDSGAWYRGYVVSPPSAHAAFNQPLPKGKKINNAALKALDANIKTGIFPCVYVHLHEYFDLSHSNDSVQYAADRFSALGMSPGYDQDAVIHLQRLGLKSKPPPIPALRLGNEVPTVPNEPLVDDIVAVINEWYNTYVYHHYLFGNYDLVNTINTIIQELYFIRRKLIYGLLTSNERVLARKKAIWQIARVINMLNRGHVVRDTKTGEILAGKEGPVRLAQEQILTALAPNYPDHSMINEIQAEVTMPKHILVDFKSCIGQGYGHGLTVYFQLRTKSTGLTESFAIKINPETRITDLNAVLFRDLPISITRGDVILNAEVFETVSLKSKNPTPMTSIYGTPNIPISNKRPKKLGRRGLASGAADISRLFRIEDKGESPFTIRMYATYFGPNEPNKDNRGWGELFERIVRGRPNGV